MSRKPKKKKHNGKKKDKKMGKDYISEKDLAEETINSINVENSPNQNSPRTGRVDFPHIDDDIGTGTFKADIAQQEGRFRDKVLMDSPSVEAGELGHDAIKDTVKASEKKLAEKLNDKDSKEKEKNMKKGRK